MSGVESFGPLQGCYITRAMSRFRSCELSPERYRNPQFAFRREGSHPQREGFEPSRNMFARGRKSFKPVGPVPVSWRDGFRWLEAQPGSDRVLRCTVAQVVAVVHALIAPEYKAFSDGERR